MEDNRYRFSSKETQTVGAIGWLDFGARMYDPYLCRWTSPDPLAEKYRSLSPYGYCAGDPVNLVDPDGMATSTHTDEFGNVVAIFDDDDLGVYRHNANRTGTEKEIKESYSEDDKSAGGDLMGTTRDIYSFADLDHPSSSDGVKVAKDAKIDFGSTELTEYAEQIMALNPSVLEYSENAAYGKEWDVKTKINNGSLLYGQYASPREAGNFVAGMFAASKGIACPLIIYGYGVYNYSNNKKWLAFLNSMNDVCLFITSPYSGMCRFVSTSIFGENRYSHRMQMRGVKYYFTHYE